MQQVSERPSRLSVLVAVFIFAMVAALAVAAGFGSTNTVGAIGFVAVAIWFVLSWRFGIAALIVLSCTDGFIKHIHASTATYILKDLTLGLVLIGMVAALAVRPELRPKGSWRGVWMWGLFMGFLAIQILNPSEPFRQALAGFRAHAIFALLYVAGVVYFDGPQRFTKAANLVIGAITFAALTGIVQYFMGDAWLNIATGLAVASRHYVTYSPLAALIPGATGLVYRAYGTLVDPESMGLACAFGLTYASAAVARSRGLGTVALAVSLVIMVVAMVLAGARSAMLGAGIGMLALLIFALMHGSLRRIVWIAAAVCLLSIPLAAKLSGGSLQARLTSTSTDYAAATRANSANAVLHAMMTKPLGIGLGATGAGGKFRVQGSRQLAVDNLYLAYMYETGPLGLIVLLGVQLSFLGLTYRAMRGAKSTATRATYAGMAAGQLGLLAASFLTQGAFDYAPLAQAFWLMSGAIAIPKRVEGAA